MIPWLGEAERKAFRWRIFAKAGISQATYFNWKTNYDVLLPNEIAASRQHWSELLLPRRGCHAGKKPVGWRREQAEDSKLNRSNFWYAPSLSSVAIVTG
jgi:hypothetical protein